MKLEVGKEYEIILKEVFNGVTLETSEGNKLSICMRDDTFEFTVSIPYGMIRKSYRVNANDGSIKCTGIGGSNMVRDTVDLTGSTSPTAANTGSMRSITINKGDPDEFGYKLLQTNNAMTWAEEFVRLKKEKNWTLDDIEEGLMVAWFANAMAAQELKTPATYKTLKHRLCPD